MSTATVSREARADILEAARWILKDNIKAAQAFRTAVAEAAMRIAQYPQIGQVRPEWAAPPYRFLTIRGYPYILFYDSSETPPIILRVLHGARDIPTALAASES